MPIKQKQALTIMGMSGVGKTTLSRKLPRNKWFHYSGDYRIATHYLADAIGDFLKHEAMQSAVLKGLLKSDSVSVTPNVSIDNLAVVSAFIGKLGKTALGGTPLATFQQRQALHHRAEVAATYDIGYFKQRAQSIYGYDYFLHDAGGSICELDDEAAIEYVSRETQIIYLHADDEMIADITQRALDYPKPLYYKNDFIRQQIKTYVDEVGLPHIDAAVPDEFIRYVVPKLMQHRSQRYLSIAERYGKIIDAKDIFAVRDEKDFLALIEQR
ncbi:EutP/PduV family microcompartment system protein [Ostreibacterium oceani]|uniref:ATPase n=1 Tax=Ostreibacterium oceani TaxID=2654998 RepID=A0A6N7F350_9GAMM|nr:EutP/PduV family microcompartment system protein [Ostreibacterium oceani]MPV86296.1 ATPase [Ostreibacterium oceani]